MARNPERLAELKERIKEQKIHEYQFNSNVNIYTSKVSKSGRFKQGICFGLCVTWIKLHMSQKTQGPQLFNKGDWRHLCIEKRHDELTLNESMAEEEFKKSKFYEAVNVHRVYKGEEVDGAAKTPIDISHDALVSRVAMFVNVDFLGRGGQHYASAVNLEPLVKLVDQKHKYHLTKITLESGGSHAICCYKSSGKLLGYGAHLYLFDQNLGEIQIETDKISDFYEYLFDVYEVNQYQSWEVIQN